MGRERRDIGDWDRALSEGMKQEQKRGMGYGSPLRGFQKEKVLDKWLKGTERKTGLGAFGATRETEA